MAAGESARAQSERMRRKIANLERYADNSEKGALGEEATAEALAELGPDWVVLHDLAWPGRRFANIDHVVVGPGGVFVIDSKNWSGKVTLSNGTLRQNGYNREKNLTSVRDASSVLAELVGAHVRPVLCFVGQPELRGAVEDVLLCSSDTVTDMLRAQPPTLSPARFADVSQKLTAQSRPATNRQSAPRPPKRSATTPRPTGQGRRQRRELQRILALVVGALLFLFVGLPLLPQLGQLIAGVVTGAASP